MKPFERLQKHNTKGNLWIYILFLLNKQKLHAWKIPSLIEKKFGFKPGLITGYRVLYRLEGEGFVKSKSEQRRRVYTITQKGKKQLELARQFYKNILKQLK